MSKKIFPNFVRPMMSESAKAPFDSPDRMFEIKLDGYRAITALTPLANLTFGLGTDWHWKRNSQPSRKPSPS
jgi:hypothetical protein